MTRIRKDKGRQHSVQDKQSREIKSKSYKKRDSKQHGIVKQQVLALGGDEQDYDLVKDIDSEEIGATPEEDVCVCSLSNFFGILTAF